MTRSNGRYRPPAEGETQVDLRRAIPAISRHLSAVAAKPCRKAGDGDSLDS